MCVILARWHGSQPSVIGDMRRDDPSGGSVSGNAKSAGAWSATRSCGALVPARGSSSVQSEPSASPTEIRQVRIPAAIPTEIPRTKRHYAVHLLCLLKVRNKFADQLLCVWAGLLELFPGKCSRDDRAPEKRTVARSSRRSRVTTLTLSSAPRIRAVLGYAAGLRRNRGPAVARGAGDHRH